MSKQYYSILTNKGEQLFSQALATKTPLNITQMAIGDGNGKAITPNKNSTKLAKEVYRTTLNNVTVDPRNNKQVIFEITIPENVGGFYIREAGLYDENNHLIAIANTPESYKPVLADGSGKISVLQIILAVNSADAVTLTVNNGIVFATRKNLNPQKITANSQNKVDNTGHTHEIDKASLSQQGITLLNSSINSNSEEQAATPKAVKTAYDKAIEAEKKALPVGSIIAFPHKITNPTGFLKCDGSTFSSSSYPDLHQAMGDSNILPNLNGEIGQVCAFATSNKPDGWIWFDDIRTEVTQEKYPELYALLVAQYGSINAVPKLDDRFIRNIGDGPTIGQLQDDDIKKHAHYMPHVHVVNNDTALSRDNYDTDSIIANPSLIYGLPKDSSLSDNGYVKPLLTNPMSEGGNETRPRSIVLKYAIKAKSNLIYWIKAHGEVINTGRLDASKLALDLQDKADRYHTHTAANITDFNKSVANNFEYKKIVNFEIRKFPDGTMIQTTEYYTASHGNSINGIILNYPESFIETPKVFLSLKSNSANIRDGFITIDKSQNNESLIKFWIMEIGYNSPEAYVDMIAVGRWK